MGGHILQSIEKIGLPIAGAALGSIVPGVGTALGAGLGGALGGAAGGVLSGGGLKGALLGGAEGGLGGYFTSGLGGSILGSEAGTPLAGGLSGPTQGSGLLGGFTGGNFLGNAAKAGGSLLGGGAGGGSSLYSLASPVLSGVLGSSANNKAQQAIDAAQNKNSALYGTIANEQFDPGNLQNTPGYQFAQEQGEQGLARKESASGNYYSGAALKEADTFNTGLASQTYNNAYNQFLQTQQQRLAGISGIAGANDTSASAKAQTALNQGQLFGQTGSAILGTLGGGTNVYNPSTGTYYNPQGGGIAQYLAMMKKQQGVLA